MKKTFLIIPILILLIFSGCNKKSSGVTAVTTELSFTAEISFMDTKSNYDIRITEDKGLEAIVISGKSDGMKLTFAEENLTISYSNLVYNTSITSLPDGIITDFLYAAFKNADINNVYSENEQYFITGKTDKYDYKIFIGQSGLPLKIEESKMGITATIKNASFL